MPRVRRKTIVSYVDAAGRRVPKDAPGATKKVEQSTKFYGFGIPGQPKDRGVPLCTDERAAQRMLEDIVRAAERGAAGLPDHRAARTPLAEYVTRFADDMTEGLASRARRKTRPDAGQVRLTRRRVEAVIAGCRWRVAADLDPGALARWLRKKVLLSRRAGGFSHQSANFYLAAARRFAWWLSARANAPVRADLFDDVPSFDPRNNRVHPRRAATPDELAAFLGAALHSTRPARRLSGVARFHLYLVAFASGFRAKELARLTPEHFGPGCRTVAMPGKGTKNKHKADQPLPAWAAERVAKYLEGRPRDVPVWPGTWRKHAARILRKDLKAAGVAYRIDTPAGPEYLDFHALRHTFVTVLAAAGVTPKVLQDLARHSDPRLTLGAYTHATAGDKADAVERMSLPEIGPAPEVKKPAVRRRAG